MVSSKRSYVAIDLGAESGRVMLGRLENGKLELDEIRRFANERVVYSGSLHWDMPRVWLEIKSALNSLPEVVDSLAVDSWGVDYALIGERGQMLENPYHYRDRRTDGMMEAVFERIPAERLYAVTGIQFFSINTLYQLFAASRQTPRMLAAADKMLMIPDLINYWLTGNAVSEFTIASTSQLLSPQTRDWAAEIFAAIGVSDQLAAPVVQPGTIIGSVLADVCPRLARTPVIAAAAHDTASAVAAIEARGDTAFISSGTWSLVGIERDTPLLTTDAFRANFTNEGGVAGTTRLLKNQLGLWLLQECRACWGVSGNRASYEELMMAAIDAPAFARLLDTNHASFLNPANMYEAICDYCRQTGQERPDSVASTVRTILEGLALNYRKVINELERLNGATIRQIRVIGGGSRNPLLNQFTADATGRTVLAGPTEATALGNIAVQMVALGEVASIAEARSLLQASYTTKVFTPRHTEVWDRQADRLAGLQQRKSALDERF